MRNRLSPALVQAGIYALGLVISKGVSLLMMPVTTAYLSPEAYGTLEMLVTLADIGSVVLGGGLAQTLFRFAGPAAGSDGQTQIAAEILGLALTLAALAAVLTQAAAPTIARALPGGGSIVQVRLLMLSLTVTACIQVPLAWMRLKERALVFLLFSVGKTIAQAAMVALALRAGFGVTGIIGAGTLSECGLTLALCWWVYREVGAALTPYRWLRLVVYGGPLVISGIATFASGSLDRWVLADTLGLAATAEYALAAKFGLLTYLLYQPFELWWSARRFQVLTEPDGLTYSARAVGFGASYVLLSAAVVSLASSFAILWLTPSAYHGAICYVPWLAVVSVLQEIVTLVDVGCYYRRTSFLPMVINIAAAIATLGLYAVLVPYYGIGGAIAAKLIVQVARILFFAVLGHRVAPIRYPVWRLSLLAVATVSLLAAFRITSGSMLELFGSIGVVAVLGATTLATKLVWIPLMTPRQVSGAPALRA